MAEPGYREWLKAVSTMSSAAAFDGFNFLYGLPRLGSGETPSIRRREPASRRFMEATDTTVPNFATLRTPTSMKRTRLSTATRSTTAEVIASFSMSS